MPTPELCPSPMRYDFLAPPRIVFGWGRRAEIGPLAASLGNRAFLVIGSRTLESNGTVHEIVHHLRHANVDAILLTRIGREPMVADVDRTVEELASFSPRSGDLLVGFGGGSAIDLAKAVAALATQPQRYSVREYLEGVGTGRQIVAPPLPVLAMPTTAGTGSEATKNAVISNTDPPFKKSLRNDAMVPKIVLIDPELACTLPAHVTAQTGMDAITQLLESLISKKAQPIPQSLCWQGLKIAPSALREAVDQPRSRLARESLAHAALLSGLVLANSGLGFAHGVAAGLGVVANIPHGLACAVMLPVAVRINRQVRLAELAEVGRLWSSNENASDADAVEHLLSQLGDLAQHLNIPSRLSQLGVRPDQIDEIVRQSQGTSMAANPREVPPTELRQLLEEML